MSFGGGGSTLGAAGATILGGPDEFSKYTNLFCLTQSATMAVLEADFPFPPRRPRALLQQDVREPRISMVVCHRNRDPTSAAKHTHLRGMTRFCFHASLLCHLKVEGLPVVREVRASPLRLHEQAVPITDKKQKEHGLRLQTWPSTSTIGAAMQRIKKI